MSSRSKTRKTTPDSDVAAAFRAYPRPVRSKLLVLRDLIYETAASTDGAGPLTETLKWGEPAYLTERTKAGSTIRIGWKPSSPEQYAMYVICTTNLVDTFRTLCPELHYEGNRAMVFQLDEELPADAVARCTALALTYHLRKRH